MSVLRDRAGQPCEPSLVPPEYFAIEPPDWWETCPHCDNVQPAVGDVACEQCGYEQPLSAVTVREWLAELKRLRVGTPEWRDRSRRFGAWLVDHADEIAEALDVAERAAAQQGDQS